jgi:NAD(P)-dependent dehydrogenase (short-subunit alcohol dehydrogenase family)
MTDNSMKGRVCLITGATSGIGRATTLALASRGAELVLLCRDRARGEETATAVRAAGAAKVDLLIADFRWPQASDFRTRAHQPAIATKSHFQRPLGLLVHR